MELQDAFNLAWRYCMSRERMARLGSQSRAPSQSAKLLPAARQQESPSAHLERVRLCIHLRLQQSHILLLHRGWVNFATVWLLLQDSWGARLAIRFQRLPISLFLSVSLCVCVSACVCLSACLSTCRPGSLCVYVLSSVSVYLAQVFYRIGLPFCPLFLVAALHCAVSCCVMVYYGLFCYLACCDALCAALCCMCCVVLCSIVLCSAVLRCVLLSSVVFCCVLLCLLCYGVCLVLSCLASSRLVLYSPI